MTSHAQRIQISHNFKSDDNIRHLSSRSEKCTQCQQITPSSSLYHTLDYGNSQGSSFPISASCVDTSRSSNEDIRCNDAIMFPSETASKFFNVLLQQNMRKKRQLILQIKKERILRGDA